MVIYKHVAALFASVSVVKAQFSGWDEGQVNSSICTWKLPRVILLRDTVFLDGGAIWWTQGMSTGEYTQTREDNRVAVLPTLSLKRAFHLSDNITRLFETKEKVASGSTGNNVAPNYVDGALLGNYAQFFMYGGLTKNSSAYPDPDADDVLEYQQYHYGGESAFSPGYVNEKLPDGVTRYVAYGAGVSVPSENKAWYFSGMRSNTSGVIYDAFLNNETVPTNVSNTLISVTFDPDSQNLETWENKTLPDTVAGRASSDGVFLPIGPKGILVFVGGVVYPEFASGSHKSENPAALLSESAEFMRVITIYNIDTEEWYNQPTESSTGPVPVLAQGCAVAQPAKDYSSFNIYYYGGYSAEDPLSNFSDDVWILSIPSFKWIKGQSGTADHARAGHRCISVYPDQMMVFGGWTPKIGTTIDCVQGGIIQLLNLTRVEWLDSYDPEVYGEYGVPEVVQAEIGGDFGGGATATTPASGWQDQRLATVFETPYPTGNIRNWYPYGKAPPEGLPPIDVDGKDKNDGGGLPGWVAPTLGVVLGLIFITCVAVGWLLWKRHRDMKLQSSQTDSARREVMTWVGGQQGAPKAVSEGTAEPRSPIPDMSEARTSPLTPQQPPAAYIAPDSAGHMSGIHEAGIQETELRVPGLHEAGAGQAETQRTEAYESGGATVHEMPSRYSPNPIELNDTGLSHLEVIEKHSHFAEGTPSPQSSSSGYPSQTRPNEPDQASSVYPPTTNPPPSSHYPGSSYYPDTDSAYPTSSSAHPTSASYYPASTSNYQVSEAGHLRPISEVTAHPTFESVEQAWISQGSPTGNRATEEEVEGTHPSPVSPTSAGEAIGEDYRRLVWGDQR